MKKFVAFILVLALCLSLCSVALAAPKTEVPNCCSVNILHAIGTYWIARTIVERAKEIKVETVNLSDFLKWALPVGIAAVGTAATVGILYALLKGNCDKDVKEDVVINTVGDLFALQENFPSDYDNGWQESSDSEKRVYYQSNQYDFKELLNGKNADESQPLTGEYDSLDKSGNDYVYAPHMNEGTTYTVTFIMDGTKITSIVFDSNMTGNTDYVGTYAPAK